MKIIDTKSISGILPSCKGLNEEVRTLAFIGCWDCWGCTWGGPSWINARSFLYWSWIKGKQFDSDFIIGTNEATDENW